MNKKILLLLGILLIFIVTLVYISGKSGNTPAISSQKMKVNASIYPLYYFASIIGGDKVEVKNLIPSGVEPHEYDPTAKDIAAIEDSSILLLNGILENWGDKMKSNLQNADVLIVTTGDGLFSLDAHHTHDGGHTAEEHTTEAKDPHIWLDPLLAKKQSQKITEAFVQEDPANAEYYKKNSAELDAKFDRLHTAFATGLATCKSRDIITSHEAFGYLAKAYNLQQESIAGLSTETEPSTKELAEVVRFAKEHDTKYIFFESLVSPKLSETIAREVGAKTMVLDPIEGIPQDDIIQGKNYFTVMEDNLKNLQIALECTE